MAGKKQNAESEVKNVQHDDCNSWPRRAGAGQGGAAEQLEKCADAIMCAQPKQAHLEVSSSQPVN